MTEVLDCGHVPTRRDLSPGTAHTPDGRTICVECAEREEYTLFMQDTHDKQHKLGPFFCYVSMDGRELTTWTGYKLATITALWQTNAGFGGWRRGEGRWYFTATDARGRTWHGNTPGRGMYARARLYKHQPEES